MAQGEGDREAWSKRSLAEEPIVRLISLHGGARAARQKATSISLPVARASRRRPESAVAVKTWAGERSRLAGAAHGLVTRGLQTPELIIGDGVPGLEKVLSALGPTVPL